jgi:hypothetical protein
LLRTFAYGALGVGLGSSLGIGPGGGEATAASVASASVPSEGAGALGLSFFLIERVGNWPMGLVLCRKGVLEFPDFDSATLLPGHVARDVDLAALLQDLKDGCDPCRAQPHGRDELSMGPRSFLK